MPALLVPLKISKTFFILMLGLVVGALVSIFCAFLPYYLQCFLSLIVLLYGSWIFWDKILLKNQKSIVAFTYHDHNNWQLQERSGTRYSARLSGDSTALGKMRVLCFQCPEVSGLYKGRKRHVIVFSDALSPASYRRLLCNLNALRFTKEDVICN